MISIPMLAMKMCYYPLGNTQAVCLTQDLPPNQDADILLLGCGDARNVLFTCFTDAARKVDVTCCDIEPLIHARNVLLYSSMIDDEANLNVERIWNIYYHWKVDKESLKLLETQVQKLLDVSSSLDKWHASVYGASIRFCDTNSLSCVRSCWTGFQLRGLAQLEKKRRLSQMQALMDASKAAHLRAFGPTGPIPLDGLNAAAPVGYDAMQDIANVNDRWYKTGAMPSSCASSLQPTELNPAFLYSPTQSIFLHHDINPLLGFPLNFAFTPIAEGSAFHRERKNVSSSEFLVDCVKGLFAQWASAFRKSLANKSVIRIFCGDALDLCTTLRSCQLSSLSHHSDIGIVVPLKFDVVDTSNLLEHLGMNVIVAASMVLKHTAQSSLYTETLSLFDATCAKRLSGIFGVDANSMALLLGLVLPVLFTNAKNSIEQSTVGHGINAWLEGSNSVEGMGFSYSRLRWKRSPGYQQSSIEVEAKALADMLLRVHDALFRHEDLGVLSNVLTNPSVPRGELVKLCRLRYNRASFAFLLHCLQASVVTDWNQCVQYLYESILRATVPRSPRSEYLQELVLNLRLYGVDSRQISKPTPAAVNAAVLAPRLPALEDLPNQLCVTVRVSREELKATFIKNLGDRAPGYLCCNFQGGDPSEKSWSNTFSTVRFAFGTWHAQAEESELCPNIEEDRSQMCGTSDLFVSVIVPTEMLLQSKLSVPWVSVRLIPTPQTVAFFKNLGSELRLVCRQMTSKDVFISQYMPGMSSLPGYPPTNSVQNGLTSAALTAHFTHDGSKIDALVRRIGLESQEWKDELANLSSTVSTEFKSPLVASVFTAQNRELKFEFPVPVSPSKYKTEIAREWSYIEVEAPLFEPLKENAPSFIFPMLFSETTGGATLPVPWTSTYIDLDIMPPLDLKHANAISWLVEHAAVSFSERERRVYKSSKVNGSLSGARLDTRTSLKVGLLSILMHYTGLRGQQTEFFGLTTTDDKMETLIFPSCLRLDLINHTVVFDAAMIPTTNAMSSDPRAVQFLQELTNHGLCQVKVSDGENVAWKAMMPALVERCRTTGKWEHTQDCEYGKEAEAPISMALSAEGISPICSCGIGKFPPGDYLKSGTEKLPDLNYMIDRYATRIALAPIFAVSEIEDCSFPDFAQKLGFFAWCTWDSKGVAPKIKRYFTNLGLYDKEKCVVLEKCAKCGKRKGENVESGETKLSRCAKCKMVQYCSRDCQIADWKKHKPFCSAS